MVPVLFEPFPVVPPGDSLSGEVLPVSAGIREFEVGEAAAAVAVEVCELAEVAEDPDMVVVGSTKYVKTTAEGPQSM